MKKLNDGEERPWWLWQVIADVFRTILAAVRTILALIRYNCGPWW